LQLSSTIPFTFRAVTIFPSLAGKRSKSICASHRAANIPGFLTVDTGVLHLTETRKTTTTGHAHIDGSTHLQNSLM
jgi:hypothetical protein